MESASFNKANRNQFIDILRGGAIVLMLWGHCIQCCYPDGKDIYLNETFKIIYSFHMPLFMTISGYLFCISSKNKNKEQLLLKKSSSLIRAIVGGTIFIIVMQDVLINHNISAFIDGRWINRLSVLWFLWSVLSATIVMCIVEKYAVYKYQHVLIILAGVLFVIVFPNAQRNLYMYPYFVIGYYFARQYQNSGMERLKYISLVVFPIMITFYDKKHYIYTSELIGNEYSVQEYLLIDGYRWVIGLVGSIFFITMLQLLLRIRLLKLIYDKFTLVGQKSLQIYVLSTVFLSYYLPIVLVNVRKNSFINGIYMFVTSYKAVYDLFFTFVLAIIYTVVLLWIAQLLEKIKLSKFVFGR